jgi:hypothetical protein
LYTILALSFKNTKTKIKNNKLKTISLIEVETMMNFLLFPNFVFSACIGYTFCQNTKLPYLSYLSTDNILTSKRSISSQGSKLAAV